MTGDPATDALSSGRQRAHEMIDYHMQERRNMLHHGNGRPRRIKAMTGPVMEAWQDDTGGLASTLNNAVCAGKCKFLEQRSIREWNTFAISLSHTWMYVPGQHVYPS